MFFDDDQHPKYGDDYFAESRMTFGEHIEALRWHLWRAIIGFAFCLVGSFFIGEPALEFIAAPVKKQLLEFKKDQLNAKFKQHEKEVAEQGDDAFKEVERDIDIQALAKRLGLDSAKAKEAGLEVPEERWAKVTFKEDTKAVA